MWKHFLSPECVAYGIAIVNEKQVWVAHQTSHGDNITVNLVQLKHHFIELFDFVLSYIRRQVGCDKNKNCITLSNSKFIYIARVKDSESNEAKIIHKKC
jgi:hypothetical protein